MLRKNKAYRFGWLISLAMLLMIAAALAGAVLGGYSTAFAQGAEPGSPTDDEVVCPTQACAQWRDLIRQKLSEGWSEQQIKDYFVEQYGERVLGAPPARGFNWLVYLVPPVAILAGIYILYKAFLSMRAKPAEQAAPEAQVEIPADDYIRRMEEELRKKD